MCGKPEEGPNHRIDAMCTSSVLSCGIPLHLGLLLNVSMSANMLFQTAHVRTVFVHFDNIQFSESKRNYPWLPFVWVL